MRMYDIIEKKRDGGELCREEIAMFIKGVCDGTVPDYQVTALLMAIYLRGMSDSETVALTLEMAASGEMLDLSRFGKLSADKHSTGGVGDKTTLIVAPTVAALGGTVAKMSGRGLGHTGGTIDKLEAIPGFRTSMPESEFFSVAEKVGVCVMGAGKDLDPADKKLYALRDVTATVGSIPLIVSSIMSKKLAGGAKNIVLDVKCGSGAFAKTEADARLLAEKMAAIGNAAGRKVSALITNMDTPLGSAVGNFAEVREAAELLRGRGRDKYPDLYSVSCALAGELISSLKGISPEEGAALAAAALSDGSAYDKFKEWIAAQGGDISVLENEDFCRAEYCLSVKAPRDGYIFAENTEGIGISAMLLGAGRTRSEDSVDPAAGILIKKKRGDRVAAGEEIAILMSSSKSALEEAREKYLSSISFADTAPAPQPLIYSVIRSV